MAPMYCSCLNIQIDAIPVQVPDIPSPESGLNEFFWAELGPNKIRKKHENLCFIREAAQNWRVVKCAICGLEACAFMSESEPQQILVNRCIEREESRINELVRSENYSVVFQVVLSSSYPAAENNHSKSRRKVNPQNKKTSMHHTAHEITKQKLDMYLLEEHRAMEDRIRFYTEQEHRKYRALQAKADHDMNFLNSVIYSLEIPEPNAERMEKMVQEFDRENNFSVMQQRSPTKDFKLTTNGSKSKKGFSSKPVGLGFLRSTSVVDEMFEIEGFDLRDESPFIPDDELEEYDKEDDHRPRRTRKPARDLCYATSLPINVPLGRKAFEEDEEEDEDDEKIEHMNPEQIAESIQALAWSCQDGTELFGDLPRRRLSTIGELVRSRPI